MSDDWSLTALSRFNTFDGAVSAMAALNPRRPLAAVYFPLLNTLIGDHQHVLLAWTAALRVIMAMALFLVLRELRIDRAVAGAAAALALLFPFSDSTALWGSASSITLSAILWLGGLLVGLRAMGGRERAHAPALMLYAASVLLYEITLPAVVLGGALYLARGERRTALRRWGSDATFAVVLFILFTSRAVHLISGRGLEGAQDPAGTVRHSLLIARQALTLGAAALVPFGTPGHRSDAVAAVAVLLVLVSVLAAWQTMDALLQADMRRWLVLAVGSFILVAAGYVMLAPADPYYSPSQVGTGNRINVVAGMGYALFAVGLARIAAGLAFSVIPRYKRWTPALTAALILAIAVGYLSRDVGDSRAWDAASSRAEAVLKTLHEVMPHPPPGSTVLASGFQLYQAPGLPIFAASWDLNGAVKLLWNDQSLAGYAINSEVRPGVPVLTCTPAGLVVAGLGQNVAVSSQPFVRYGHIVDINTATRRLERPAEVSSCRRALTTH